MNDYVSAIVLYYYILSIYICVASISLSGGSYQIRKSSFDLHFLIKHKQKPNTLKSMSN